MDKNELIEGQKAVHECQWFNDMIRQGTLKEFDVPVHEDHFVAGKLSPFLFRVGKTIGNDTTTKTIVAAWIGPHGTNSLGVANGGAVAAIFDFCTAISAWSVTNIPGAFSTHKTLNVKYLKPTPLRKCIKIEVTANIDHDKGINEAFAVLTDVETNVACAECQSTLVDLARRRQQSKF